MIIDINYQTKQEPKTNEEAKNENEDKESNVVMLKDSLQY